MKLFIGILTFNRLDSLQKLVGHVKSLTAAEFELVVAEGGGTDGTVKWCIENGLRVITGPNKGIAWSKNTLLYYFLHHTECDQIIILEDDCRVWEKGWEQEWMLACKAWEHVNWPLCPTNEYEFGANTPGSPIRTNWFGGHCTITSRASLEKVGYMDPRFIGYGGEHAEWTWRFYEVLKEQWGEPGTRNKTVPCLNSHVGVEFKDSLFDKDQYKNNMALMYAIQQSGDPVYRDPWRDEKEKAEFIAVVEKSLTLKVEQGGIAGARCPLCGGIGNPVGEREGVPIRQCCGILLAWAWTSEEDYENFYVDDMIYHTQQQQAEGLLNYWDRDADLVAANFQRLEWLERLRPKARTLMDVGAGTGALVYAASLKHYIAVGLEPNPVMCREAEKRGRKLMRGNWKHLSWRFEIITLVDVFEHLTRPKECLARLKEHLEPGGIIYIEMPEAGCPQHHADGLQWRHIRPKQHLALYTDQAARQMFYVCGLRVEFSLRPRQGTLGKIVYGLTAA